MRSPFRSRHRRVRPYAAGLFALAVAACSSNSSTQPSLVSGTNGAGTAASLSISPSSATDSIGHTTQFTATVYDRRGVAVSNQKVRWHSSDSTIVRIDGTGRAKRWGVGRTTVTASVDSLSATAQTTALGVPIASIVVTPNPANPTVGQTVQFKATLLDSVGDTLTGRPVTWLSSAPSVISIDTLGLATAQSVGTATVSATSAGILAVASVNVGGTASNLPATVVDLAAVASSATSATLSFTAVSDGNGGNASYDVRYAVHPISWGSATTVTSGTCSTPVTGYAPGAAVNCTITGLAASTNYDFQLVAFRGTMSNNAVFGPLSNVATATTPSAPVASVATVVVSPTSTTDTVGQHYQFTATVKDSAGNVLTGRTITWASSATGVATVNSSGYTSSVGTGSASITATSGGVTGSATLSVVAAPVQTVTSVSVTPTPDTLTPAATKQLTATVKDQNGGAMTGVTVSWSSNATGVATVSSSGLVTAVATGTATITATSSGKSGTATVVVTSGTSTNPPPPPPTGIWRANEPTGMTQLINSPFNTVATTEGGTAEGWTLWYAGTISPRRPMLALRFRRRRSAQFVFPTSHPYGSGPGTLSFVPPAGYTKVYISFAVKLSSNYFGPGPSEAVLRLCGWHLRRSRRPSSSTKCLKIRPGQSVRSSKPRTLAMTATTIRRVPATSAPAATGTFTKCTCIE